MNVNLLLCRRGSYIKDGRNLFIEFAPLNYSAPHDDKAAAVY